MNGEEIAEQLNDSIDVAVSGVDGSAESYFFDQEFEATVTKKLGLGHMSH